MLPSSSLSSSTSMRKAASIAAIMMAVLGSSIFVHSFVMVKTSVPNVATHGLSKHANSCTRGNSLFGRKIKRGGLGSAASSVKGKSSAKGKKKSSTNVPISEDLANFMNEKKTGYGNKRQASASTTEKTLTKKEKRRQQSETEIKRINEIDTILDRLKDVLEKRTGDIQDVLGVLTRLLSIDDQFLFASSTSSSSRYSNNLRQMLMGSGSSYRLAWVGSDESICHIGTGLHKVPLARMQEVFLNIKGQNHIEILEVISLLGPFPNVKNTLLGTTKVSTNRNDEYINLQIKMDSMIDGTGKELLAGKDDNIRLVDLNILFAEERVIAAAVPCTGDPLSNDGKNLLIFVKETYLEEKLESLRVS